MNDLVRGLKAGDPAAFEALVRDYGDRIYRFAKRMVGDRWAEDVTQEVLVRVFRSIGDYEPTGRFESWLFTIANNLSVDQARKRKEEAALPEVAATRPGPPDVVEAEERRQAILKAVERLPLEQRQVFLLREEAGLSFREIAEIMECPLNTALGRMHYAMENLRKALKIYGM